VRTNTMFGRVDAAGLDGLAEQAPATTAATQVDARTHFST
jgi:hypothetical protein